MASEGSRPASTDDLAMGTGVPPRCFVIMPYGGSDPDRRAHFNGVFLSIITPAAVAAGYSVIRSDIAGVPGNITNDIIRDLAISDLVIADLTGGNPNVLFELGVRHVLRKSGTVHIVDGSSEINFDLRPYRAVKYSTSLSEIPAVIDEIAKQIRLRTETRDRPDNPVHDALPGLPLNYMETGPATLQKAIETSRVASERLEEENAELRRRLETIAPGGIIDVTQVSIDGILDHADGIMQSSGEHVLLRLHAAIQAEGRDGFVKELREVLRSEYLTDNDYAEMVHLCRNLNLQAHLAAILEVAVSRHAGPEFETQLASAYMDSPNPSVREKGRLQLEHALNIEHQDGKALIQRRPTRSDTQRALGSLLDGYADDERWEWVASVCESALAILGSSSIILRNLARAYGKMGDDRTEATFARALEENLGDDRTHSFYGEYLTDRDRIPEAYEQFEFAVRTDPLDPGTWLALAAFVWNRKICRDPMLHLKSDLTLAERRSVIVPLVLKAVEGPRAQPAALARAIMVLTRAEFYEEAQALSSGTAPTGEYSWDVVDAVLRGGSSETVGTEPETTIDLPKQRRNRKTNRANSSSGRGTEPSLPSPAE